MPLPTKVKSPECSSCVSVSSGVGENGVGTNPS